MRFIAPISFFLYEDYNCKPGSTVKTVINAFWNIHAKMKEKAQKISFYIFANKSLKMSHPAIKMHGTQQCYLHLLTDMLAT